MHKTLCNKIIVDNFSVPHKAGITRHTQKSEHYAEPIKLLFKGPYCLRQGRSKFGSSISSCHPMIQSCGSHVYSSQRERVGVGSREAGRKVCLGVERMGGAYTGRHQRSIKSRCYYPQQERKAVSSDLKC